MVKQVTVNHMNKAVKRAVKDQTHIGSHSLYIGGAKTIHLKGINSNTIKKIDRWSSSTFLMYTNKHITAFTNNISRKMSTPITFHNIACQPMH